MDITKVKTLKDLARVTGFTESTISRTLNGIGTKYRISDETQNIIMEAARKAHFSFNENARGLRLKKTMTLGLIVPDISNSFFAKMASLIEREARLHQYTIFLCDSGNRTAVERSSIRLLQKRKVDGIIVCPVGLASDHLLELFQDVPLVLIDRYFPGIDIPYVSSDDYSGSFTAVQHLISLGHTKIACVQGLESTSQNEARLKGYRNALAKADIPENPKFIFGNAFEEKSGYESAREIIQMPKIYRPTAIFSFSSIITLGLLKAFAEKNIKIPEDFSLISFDEQSYSSLLASPMTTIAQSKEDMGQLAFQMLLEQMGSGTKIAQQGVLLPTHVIYRNSVAPLP